MQQAPLPLRHTLDSLPCSYPSREFVILLAEDFYLIPEPVGVPPTLLEATCSAPSLVDSHNVNSGLLCVTCNVRRKCTKSHASSGFTTSAKDGMGVPSTPVMNILYRFCLLTPHLNRD